MIHDLFHLLLALQLVAGAVRRPPWTQGNQDQDQNFHKKVALMLQAEPENPKCFAEGRKDFTCFWVEDEERAASLDQYSFTYTYRNGNSSRCPLRVVPAAGGKLLFVCHLNKTQMFVQMEIQVHRQGTLIHNRTLLVELVFLLNPPANVTVSAGQGRLNVTWLPPPLKYMDDSMMYEVGYTAAGSHTWQVEVVRASSELILRGLQPGTVYRVRVRVKLDGISYSGYWSSWSQTVSVETLPAELDLLMVSLALSTVVVLLAMLLTVALSNRRFLVQKIWPTVPVPDSKFQGLFTLYGGDFQEWLEQTSGGLWLTPAVFSPRERPSPLEVLSELSLCSSLSPVASSLEASKPSSRSALCTVTTATATAATTTTTTTKHNQDHVAMGGWPGRSDQLLLDRLRTLHQSQSQNPAPCSQSSLLESQDAYVTLTAAPCSQEGGAAAAVAAALPLETLFTSGPPASCDSHSDLGSAPRSSGSGRLSSQSSLEYPNPAWTARGPSYTFMAAADSGVSMDYSPMSLSVTYANQAAYKNQLAAHQNAFC